MKTSEIKEVADGAAWIRAGIAKKFSVYQQLSRALGGDWAVSRSASIDHPADLLHPGDAGGLGLRHQPTGLTFRLVPQFSFVAGISADEVAALVAAVAGHGDRSDRLPPVSCAPVTVPPFLMCATPLRIGDVGALIRRDGVLPAHDAPSNRDRVAFFRPDEARQALAGSPFDLPGSLQWESAYRAGAASPFPWGDAIPDGLQAIPPHVLEFSPFAVFPEGVTGPTDGAPLVRGGVIAHAPWTIADGGWLGLVAGLSAPWGPDAIATVRPVHVLSV